MELQPLTKPHPNIFRGGPRCVVLPFLEARQEPSGITSMRAYALLCEDLHTIFEYVEPCLANWCVHSHRIYVHLLRACTEVEALCRQVFRANSVPFRRREDNIIRFSDLDGPMKLSAYRVQLSLDSSSAVVPFESFASARRQQRAPVWYSAYGAVKHDRSLKFSQATLQRAIEATAAVFVLLSAQFGTNLDSTTTLSDSGGFLVRHGLFRIMDAPSWTVAERYDFDWEKLRESESPWSLHSIPVRPDLHPAA